MGISVNWRYVGNRYSKNRSYTSWPKFIAHTVHSDTWLVRFNLMVSHLLQKTNPRRLSEGNWKYNFWTNLCAKIIFTWFFPHKFPRSHDKDSFSEENETSWCQIGPTVRLKPCAKWFRQHDCFYVYIMNFGQDINGPLQTVTDFHIWGGKIRRLKTSAYTSPSHRCHRIHTLHIRI